MYYRRYSKSKLLIGVLLVLGYFVAGIVLLVALNLPSLQSGNNSNGMIDVRVRSVERLGPYKAPNRPRLVWCQALHFVTGRDRPTTALVSFPGSGNTWLRYLIQQATGVNTGSVYKDYGLLKNGFPGERVANSSVSLVKTHERGPQAFQGFNKAVLLVRDPSNAIQAEFNRQGGGHIGFAPPHRYKLRNGKFWAKFVEEQLMKWKKTNLDWLFNFTGPISVVFYEDLVNDLEPNLRDLVKFVELPVLESNIECALRRKEGIYRRKKRLLTLDPFTPTMKENIRQVKEDVYWHLHAYIQNHKDEIR